MHSTFVAAFAATVLFFFGGAGQAFAHEGHDHGTPPSPIAANAAPRAEASSDAYELLAIARDGDIEIYLDRFATNEPVNGAAIEVETPAGSQRAVVAGDKYRLQAPWASKPGRYDLIFAIDKDGVADVLTLALEIPSQPTSNAPGIGSWLTSTAFAGGIKERVGRNDPAVIAAAIVGFLLGILSMALLLRRRNRAALILPFLVGSIALVPAAADAHEGEDHSQPVAATSGVRDMAQRLPEGSVFVPKATQRILAIRTIISTPAVFRRTVELPGRIIPNPNASGLVQASVAGRLSPPPGGFPRLGTPVKKGDVLAYVTQPLQAIDVSDMRQRQGELDQQISIVERRLARYESLVPGGAVPRSQLEDTRLELEGLRVRRASLDKVRREPEALIAPVDGIVAEGAPVAGQMAQTNGIIFHIVDPTSLWVEALSFDALPGTRSASARIGNDRTVSLVYQGAGFAGRNQSIPVHFAIDGDVSGLRVGQFVTVLATTDEEKQGIAISRAGLVRSANGQDIVYEHVAAEMFEPRSVRVEPLDGDRVFIAAGLGGGKRVVVQGAELLDQVR